MPETHFIGIYMYAIKIPENTFIAIYVLYQFQKHIYKLLEKYI